MYSKKYFGKALAQELIKELDIEKLAQWAHDLYIYHAPVLDRETYDAIMTVMVMGEGEEFVRSKEELLKFAANLQK